jgi:class 3 adenylate cyclase
MEREVRYCTTEDGVRIAYAVGGYYLFADRGEFAAKGFEEPVRVYEVRWED